MEWNMSFCQEKYAKNDNEYILRFRTFREPSA